MRCRKRFVEIDVHGVDTQVTRPHPANNSVEVSPITVEEGPGLVYCRGNLDNLVFEQTTSVGIRKHECSHRIVERVF